MAQREDAQTVMEKVLGSQLGADGFLLDDGQFQLIAGAFAEYRGSNFEPVDPDNPTDEEKAKAVLDAIYDFGTGVIASQIKAMAKAQADSAAEAQTSAVLAQFGLV